MKQSLVDDDPAVVFAAVDTLIMLGKRSPGATSVRRYLEANGPSNIPVGNQEKLHALVVERRAQLLGLATTDASALEVPPALAKALQHVVQAAVGDAVAELAAERDCIRGECEALRMALATAEHETQKTTSALKEAMDKCQAAESRAAAAEAAVRLADRTSRRTSFGWISRAVDSMRVRYWRRAAGAEKLGQTG